MCEILKDCEMEISSKIFINIILFVIMVLINIFV